MTILWPGVHLDYHFKAEKYAFRDKSNGSLTGMKKEHPQHPEKHWFAQGFEAATCANALRKITYKHCCFFIVLTLTFSPFQGICTKRYLLCFKTMFQMGILAKCVKRHPKTMQKTVIRIAEKLDCIFPRRLREPLRKPSVSEVPWGYIFAYLPDFLKFYTKRYISCFKT